MTHYHVTRHDFNLRTCEPEGVPADLGFRMSYPDARALAVQDEKQFRVPTAQRWIVHRYETIPCKEDQHVAGPAEKGHAVR